jgi:hypothetical protein
MFLRLCEGLLRSFWRGSSNLKRAVISGNVNADSIREKAMTDEKLETGIEAIQAMLAARDASSQANVIDAVPESLALPAPWSAKRKKRKSDETDVGQSVGSDAEGTSSQALSMAIGGLPLGGIGPMPAGPPTSR